jgi:hypothetical protein
VPENEISQWSELSLFAKYPNQTGTFLANDDWLFCGKGSLQSVALEESARVQKVKAVLQATVWCGAKNKSVDGIIR